MRKMEERIFHGREKMNLGERWQRSWLGNCYGMYETRLKFGTSLQKTHRGFGEFLVIEFISRA